MASLHLFGGGLFYIKNYIYEKYLICGTVTY